MTVQERDTLIEAIAINLNTHDKRYMFLRMEFKELVSRIQLEGSAYNCAWNIFTEFQRQQMIGSLIACLNVKLDLDLHITYK